MTLWDRMPRVRSRLRRFFGQPASDLARICVEIERTAPERARNLLESLLLGLEGRSCDMDRFRAAEVLSAAVYPEYRFSEYGRIWLKDQAFNEYYQRFMDVGNWHSMDRKYTLDQLLKLVLHLGGDVAECGTFKGASAWLMCAAFRDSSRMVHLFDSFEGLSAPDGVDGDYWVAGAMEAPEIELRRTLADFDNYRIYKGWIPERFTEVRDRKFSFVHIDVDLYQPTLDSLSFFYERLLPGGLLLMDDYGFNTCPGAKLAADEFFASRPEQIIMLPTGQAFVIIR